MKHPEITSPFWKCMVVQCLRTMLDKLLSAGWYVMTNGTLLFAFLSLYWMRSFLSIPLALLKQRLELCQIFKEPPVLALRKPKRLKDILVRADISPRSAYNGQCQKCDSRRCMTCKNIQCTQQFCSTHTEEEFIIYCKANCKT
jgi:hypothetical protein